MAETLSLRAGELGCGNMNGNIWKWNVCMLCSKWGPYLYLSEVLFLEHLESISGSETHKTRG
jgi:hypothetical protein